MELKASNAVIVARQFNPSILTQIWLVRNGVAQEDEFEPGCVFADGVSQVVARSFSLLVVPNRLQFTPLVEEEQQAALVIERLGRIVRALPHTPYTAVGLNFTWFERPEGESIAQLTRRLFFRPGSVLDQAFDVDDAHFGAYMSKDVGDMRLKLDIKPVLMSADEQSEARLQLAFNFHKEIASEEPVRGVVDAIARWPETKRIAVDLVARAFEGGSVER